MRRRFVVVMIAIVCVLPLSAHAIYFGGPVIPFPCPLGPTGVCVCLNVATYVVVGPPRPGAFVWSLVSKTYASGPAWTAGQYVLGRASVPYFCVLSVLPTIVVPGLHVDFLGTSRPTRGNPITIGTTTALWIYSQFTTPAEYDAEIDRLEASYKACIAERIGSCEGRKQLALPINEERQKRFGPRTP